MSRRLLTRGAPALLLLSLTLNLVFVSCAADAVTNPMAQDQDAAILTELASMNARLDSIDARTRRIDESSVIAVQSIVESLSDPEADFIGSLVHAIELSADVTAEVCAELSGSFGGEYSVGPDFEGGAHGEVGPNVVEAEVQAKLQGRMKAEVNTTAGLEGSLTGSVCASAGADLGMDLPAVAAAMRSALAGLGIDGSSMSTLIAQIEMPSTASFAATSNAVRSALPLPSGLLGALENPVSLIANSPELVQFAEGLRCNPSAFPGGSIFADAQSRLCSLQIPNAETYIGILNGLDGLPNAVASIDSGLQTVCAKVNGLLPSRIDINPVSVSILGTSYQVFPGYDAYLFGNRTGITC
jgi:hypothetical protein